MQRNMDSKEKSHTYVQKRYSTNKLLGSEKADIINLVRDKPKLITKTSDN